jgi:bacterioferritin
MNKSLTLDVAEIRKRARNHIEDGAVTHAYRGHREEVVALLNAALATELVCYLRYKRHYFMASGLSSSSIADELAEHAAEEQAHADAIAKRITQLGGEPNFNPKGLLERSHAEYVEGRNLLEMLKEDLVAERIAIETYTAMVRHIGDDDPTTRRLIESILEKEEEHADDLVDVLSRLDGMK